MTRSEETVGYIDMAVPTWVGVCYSFPQSAEGTCNWGAQCSAAGFGDSYPIHAGADGGWEHDVDALDQEDHCRGRTLRAATVSYLAARRPTLQGA